MRPLLDLDRWICLHLATLGGEPVETVDLTAPLSIHDLDSFDAIEMALAIERDFGCELDPEFLMNRDQNVGELIETLRSVLKAQGAVSGPQREPGQTTRTR